MEQPSKKPFVADHEKSFIIVILAILLAIFIFGPPDSSKYEECYPVPTNTGTEMICP